MNYLAKTTNYNTSSILITGLTLHCPFEDKTMPCGDLPIQDKVVVVTGGGSGINFAFVQLVLKNGARGIIIADLRLGKEAQDLVDKEQKAVFSQCDVTKRKDLEGLIKTSVEKFGDVPDVYVAGAGVFEPAC